MNANRKVVGLLVLIVVLALASLSAVMAEGNTVTYTGQGFSDGFLESEVCDPPDLGQDRDFVVSEDGSYLKWILTASGAESATITGPFGTFDMIQAGQGSFHKATNYYPVDQLNNVTASWVGNVSGNVQLTVSNGCSGVRVESLDVTKTAVTSFTREHFWDIDKSVATENGYTLNGYPKIWLYIDGSGNETATWTVDVSYEGYVDSGFNVSGEIAISNTGQLEAVITSVVDVLAGSPIGVSCGVTFPYTLLVGQTLRCTYDVGVDSKIEGSNVATVTTERASYSGSAEIVWGAPTTEINKTVSVTDSSDLFGIVALGSATAPNGATFTYSKAFAWADYGADNCGSFTYDNTATVAGQSASAALKVNVQCYIYESAWAKGDSNVPFCGYFANWGWTNPILPGSYTMDLWAGAGQCDTSKGMLVGTVTANYDGANVNVTYNVGAPFLLTETHVYAGYAMFPQMRNGRNTVAPGQYTNNGPFDGNQVYVIAHGVVGIPDPNFGP